MRLALDWVFALILAFILGIGGIVGYAKRDSEASLYFGMFFSACYTICAYRMVYAPGMEPPTAKNVNSVSYMRKYNESRTRWNTYAAFVGAVVLALFLIRYQMGTHVHMTLPLAGLGLLSIIIHGAHANGLAF